VFYVEGRVARGRVTCALRNPQVFKPDDYERFVASSKSDWRRVLYRLSENVQSKITGALFQRSCTMAEFKRFLDQTAQQAIVDTLIELKLPIRLVSEEGDRVFGDGEYTLVADPVDGSTNLSRGLHPAATSLSVSETGLQSGVVAGIVKDLYTGETYYAERGRGATLKGQPIRVSQPEGYNGALISIDISKGPRLDRTRRLIEESLHLRSEGCSSMSLCQVASGFLDAHIDLRGIVRATDVSAGLLILGEAGGVYAVDGVQGGDFPLTRGTHMRLVAAASKELLSEINVLAGRP
jgi:myo-inositol-1(or 4)-monophosphatase